MHFSDLLCNEEKNTGTQYKHITPSHHTNVRDIEQRIFEKNSEKRR